MDTTQGFDEKGRRELIRKLHKIERRMLAAAVLITPLTNTFITTLEESVANWEGHRKGIEGMARGFEDGKRFTRTNNNKGEVIESLYVAFKEILNVYHRPKSTPIDERNDAELFKTLFTNVVWEVKVRDKFYNFFSRALPHWEKVRKRINGRLRVANGDRINRFEYKSFLAAMDRYPLQDDVKAKILEYVEEPIQEISRHLQMDFNQNADRIMKVMSLYEEYIKLRNDIMKTIMRIPAKHFSSGVNITSLSTEEFNIGMQEVINLAFAKIAPNLFRYNGINNLSTFVHPYCEAALSEWKTSKKMVRVAGQFELRRRVVFEILNKHGNDYHAALKEINEVSPVEFDMHTLMSLSASGNVLSVEHDFVSDRDEGEDNSLKRILPSGATLEDTILDEAKQDLVLDAIETLPEIERQIIMLQMTRDKQLFKTQSIAETLDITYDQARSYKKKAETKLALYVRKHAGDPMML